MPNAFERFFTKGEVKRIGSGGYTTLKKEIQKIPAPKPIPPPKIDPKVKQFFEKDVKKFFENDVKNVAVSLGKTFENALMMPQKIGDLFNNIATNLNSPILLPILVVVGAVVVVQVIKR